MSEKNEFVKFLSEIIAEREGLVIKDEAKMHEAVEESLIRAVRSSLYIEEMKLRGVLAKPTDEDPMIQVVRSSLAKPGGADPPVEKKPEPEKKAPEAKKPAAEKKPKAKDGPDGE